MSPALQRVQFIYRHIITFGIGNTSNRDATISNNLTLWFYSNLTVLRQALRSISILVIVAIFIVLRTCSTIHESLVTTSEDIAIALQHIGLCADLTAIDMHIGATEDIALRALIHSCFLCLSHITFTTPVVITSASTEDVAHHMTIPQFNMSPTAFVDSCAILN